MSTKDGRPLLNTAQPPRPGDDELVAELQKYFSTLTHTELGPDDDYFTLGLVASLQALQIVTHVEQTYGITVDVADLDLDNFRTAARVAGFVTAKRGEQGGRAGGGATQ
ncbi:acyl carrier protein [Streptomyces sp. NPDC048057]|uniref:acyl carrier protein n=1 Tax=Streptomyces sp. NPDC048057 TaxID=3155628 RepID=UPI0033CBB4C9